MRKTFIQSSDDWSSEIRNRTSRYYKLKSQRQAKPKARFIVSTLLLPAIIQKKASVLASDEEEAMDLICADTFYRDEGCKNCKEREECVFFDEENEGQSGLVEWFYSYGGQDDDTEISFEIEKYEDSVSEAIDE